MGQKNTYTKECLPLDFVFSDVVDNGLYLNKIYVPEEVLIHILSYVPASDILKYKLVCKKWYNMIKTHSLWSLKYYRKYGKTPKSLPWYVFYALFATGIFDHGFTKNNCGSEQFKHWNILKNGGDQMAIERNCIGCEPYPENCPDFRGAKTCFVSSFGVCQKQQNITLSDSLACYIINKHRPHIYCSEWVAGRFDCGGAYALEIELFSSAVDDNNPGMEGEYFPDSDSEENNTFPRTILERKRIEFRYAANEATSWRKIEVVLKDYTGQVDGIIFKHEACDDQFWRGHYGPKMAGCVIRLSFDTLQPEIETNTETNTDDNEILN